MNRIEARAPRGPVEPPPVLVEPDAIATYLTDASRYPGGHTPRVHQPTTEGQLAWVVRHEPRLLAVGAQSSLTGGATPKGDALVSLARMDSIGAVELDGAEGRVRLGPGVPLVTLQQALAERGCWYPPVPTFTGALVGGVVSTNAAGAATWKYGTTRDWVLGLTVVLASGDVLEVRRGQCRASDAGRFEVALPDGRVLDVPVPGYRMPDVPKRSAGYHAAPGMDLVDLFVGSEGTLGVISEVELKVLRGPPASLLVLVPFPDDAAAIAFTAELRQASRRTWKERDRRGLDVRAVESIDRRCIELLREDGELAKQGVELPADTGAALFVQLELPEGIDAAEELASFGGGTAKDTCVTRFLGLLAARGALDGVEVALPGDAKREQQLLALREAVPMCVNHRVQAAQRAIDKGIHKVGGDMIVPFSELERMVGIYREAFTRRGLDHAIWGHVSDGNLHPNVIPKALADVTAGKEALFELGREVVKLGGCPLAEHGTGRNPVKQRLVHVMYGDEGIAQMRATKKALDPTMKLAPGVIFPEA